MSDTAIVKTFLDKFCEGDIESALATMHDAVVAHEPAGLPTGGEYEGKQAFVSFLEKVGATYSVQLHDYQVMDCGPLVLAVIESTWTSHATGSKVDMKFCELYTVEGGLITAIDVFPKDTRALYEITVTAE